MARPNPVNIDVDEVSYLVDSVNQVINDYLDETDRVSQGGNIVEKENLLSRANSYRGALDPGADWNSVPASGFYVGDSLTNEPNQKSNNWVHVIHAFHNANTDDAFQLGSGFDQADPIVFRKKTGGTWGPWYEVVSREESLGAVTNQVLVWDGSKWTPKHINTQPPTLSSTSLTMNEDEEVVITINNYSDIIVYTTQDDTYTTSDVIENKIYINSGFVDSDTSQTVRINAKTPGVLASDWVDINITILNAPTTSDTTIQVVDFSNEYQSIAGWSLV